MVLMEPKYSLKQIVIIKSKTFKNCFGEITEIERLFKEVDRNNNFNPDGLVTLENTIKDCSLPYTFDGETLVIEFPEQDFGTLIRKAFTHTSKFYGYGYTIKLKKSDNIKIPFDDYNIFLNEKSIKPFKQNE
jgi:formate-dependent nitrite reductase cytochrome c552 subunit